MTVLPSYKGFRYIVEEMCQPPSLACLAQEIRSQVTEAFPQHSLGWVLVLGVWSPSKTTHSCEEKLGTLVLLVVSYWSTHINLPVLKKRNIFPKCHIICNDSPTCEKARDSFLLLFLLFLLIFLYPKPAPIGPQCSKSWPIIFFLILFY